jgi:hypothetical protein
MNISSETLKKSLKIFSAMIISEENKKKLS